MERLFNTVIIFGMVVFRVSVLSSEETTALNTLTTAKKHGTASPKPSSFYRRINVERVTEFSSTPLELFHVKDPERRNHIDGVWKWDFWCQLQPKHGNCSAVGQQPALLRQSYYYDAQLDSCSTFVFSGCDGNRNNFPSRFECERHCMGSSYMSLKESTRTTFCGLQPNAGLCLALLHRYYYDVNVNECKLFVYGGCGGNKNRFKTYDQCRKRCKE